MCTKKHFFLLIGLKYGIHWTTDKILAFIGGHCVLPKKNILENVLWRSSLHVELLWVHWIYCWELAPGIGFMTKMK